MMHRNPDSIRSTHQKALLLREKGSHAVATATKWRDEGRKLPLLLFLLLCPLLLTACLVDTDIPANAQLTCTKESHCPEGWTCDGALCQEGNQAQPDITEDTPKDQSTPEDQHLADAQETAEDLVEDTIETHRLDDKVEICEALYAKTTECETEAREAFGDEVYAPFEASQEDFVNQACVPELLGEATDQELDDILLQVPLMSFATCPLFISSICPMVEEEYGELPGCPE